jgi:hypothetical protein
MSRLDGQLSQGYNLNGSSPRGGDGGIGPGSIAETENNNPE